MQQFQFHSASSVEDALVFLQENGSRCKIIAGGTDLIPALRLEDIHPEFVLNVLEIEELRGIKEEDGFLWIGPTTTFTEIAESDLIRRNFPMLAQAAASVAGP